MSLVRFLWGYYRRFAWWAVVALLTVPVYGAASAALVSLIDPVFTDVLLVGDRPAIPGVALPGSGTLAPLPGGDRAIGLKRLADEAYSGTKRLVGVEGRALVFFTPLLVLAVFLVRASADVLGAFAFQRIGLGVTTELRNDLHWRLMVQDARFHAEHPSGELVSRVISDVSLMQSSLASRLFDVVQQSLTLVLLLSLLVSTDAGLAAFILVAGPLFILILAGFGRGARRASRDAQTRMARVTAVLLEGLRGHPVVKAFGGEAHERSRFREATAGHLRASLRAQRLSLLSSASIETLAILVTALFLMYAGLRIRSGALTVPLLIQFLANVWLLYEPLRKLNGANMALQPLIAVLQRVGTVLSAPDAVQEQQGAHALSPFRDRIVFDHVSVSYNGRKALDSVSFEIRRGEVVALVGASGAGKSTLASLLPRFFDPDEGCVTIDGHDLRHVSLRTLRAQIGIVTQHTILFDETIRNNIAYARPDATEADVERAARAAFAHEFVRAKPGGYDASAGEFGLLLSGGERQRIAIARALLKDAPILVLDEATSQLDSEAASIVHRALQNLMQGRTVLIVAHHLATVSGADRIVVLDRGSIVEMGRHEELLVREGTYRRLFDHWMATDEHRTPSDDPSTLPHPR